MSELYQSLSHAKWDCKYHVVFVPKPTKEGHLRPNTSATGNHFPLTSPTEGMPDHRRPPDVGPRPYVHSDSTQASGGISDRLSEREKRHRDRPVMWQRTKLHRRALLGPRLRSIHRRVRTGAGSHIHPRTGCSGWSSQSILNQPMRRATRDA